MASGKRCLFLAPKHLHGVDLQKHTRYNKPTTRRCSPLSSPHPLHEGSRNLTTKRNWRESSYLEGPGTAHLLLEQERPSAGIPGSFRLQSFEQLVGIRSACGRFQTQGLMVRVRVGVSARRGQRGLRGRALALRYRMDEGFVLWRWGFGSSPGTGEPMANVQEVFDISRRNA